jgi:hypothetical protein
MDFLLLFALNSGSMVLLYYFLKRKVDKTYNQGVFLDRVEKEVGTIITELNQTTERNIQLIENKLDSLRSLSTKVDYVIRQAEEDLGRLQDEAEILRRRDRSPGQPHYNQPRVPKIEEEPLDPREQKKRQVSQLVLQGLELSEVSEKTGMSIGEIELIMALTRR